MSESTATKKDTCKSTECDDIDDSEYNHFISNSSSTGEDIDDQSSDNNHEYYPKIFTNKNNLQYKNAIAKPLSNSKRDFSSDKDKRLKKNNKNHYNLNNVKVNHSDNNNNNRHCDRADEEDHNYNISTIKILKNNSSSNNDDDCDNNKECNESNNNSKKKPNLKKYLYVRIKTNNPNDSICKCKIEKNTSVKKLKNSLKKILNNDNDYRIIYRGRLLKDVDNLSKYNIMFNDTLYAIKLSKKRNENNLIANSGISSSQLSTINDESNDYNKLTQNEHISKLISSMLDNSDFIKSLMDSNKQLKKLREKNSDLNHMLNDSQALKQSFEMIKNPSLMKELMRNTDRAISNIEAIPGGFNTLRRMYHNIQEPMYASVDMPNESKKNQTKTYDLKASSPHNSKAFPNPWATKDKNVKNKNPINNDLDKYLMMNNNLFD
ncbi:ubiquitin-like protein, putative, partial [Hepatocystis sp. ex Piliocolobus tephrosceles]